MIRDTGIRAGLLMKQVLIQLSNRSREGFGRQIVRDAEVGMIRPYTGVLHMRTLEFGGLE